MSQSDASDQGGDRFHREAARIEAENRRRDREIPADFYSPSQPANLFLRHGQERALLRALTGAGLVPLGRRRVLEVGCGTGRWLRLFETFGASRRALAGIDLDYQRLAPARANLAGADLRQGDASRLPWNSERFDIVFQSTVLSSILDPQVRARVAREMLRVLRPGGVILWYDLRFDNPANPHVAGLGGRHIRALYPGCRVTLRRVTLAPPLARRVVPVSWPLAALLEASRVLNSHLMATVHKRSASGDPTPLPPS